MFNFTSKPPLYDVDAVQPMRDELVAVGFEELLTPEQVDNAITENENETVLVMINSVCGCAAGSARPGVSLALQHNIIPDKLYTVFAGQERDAVEKVRSYIKNFPPSSPGAALFKNGEVLFMLQRFDIEGYGPEHIANELKSVFDEHCTKEGPSISPDNFAKVMHAKACGSKIPLFKNN